MTSGVVCSLAVLESILGFSIQGQADTEGEDVPTVLGQGHMR